jgi:hypothetical protein
VRRLRIQITPPLRLVFRSAAEAAGADAQAAAAQRFSFTPITSNGVSLKFSGRWSRRKVPHVSCLGGDFFCSPIRIRDRTWQSVSMIATNAGGLCISDFSCGPYLIPNTRIFRSPPQRYNASDQQRLIGSPWRWLCGWLRGHRMDLTFSGEEHTPDDTQNQSQPKHARPNRPGRA